MPVGGQVGILRSINTNVVTQVHPKLFAVPRHSLIVKNWQNYAADLKAESLWTGQHNNQQYQPDLSSSVPSRASFCAPPIRSVVAQETPRLSCAVFGTRVKAEKKASMPNKGVQKCAPEPSTLPPPYTLLPHRRSLPRCKAPSSLPMAL